MGSLMREQAVTNSNLQTADLQRQNMQQQMGQRQQQLTAEQSLGAARYINYLGKQLLSAPDQQWGAILEPQLPQLQQLGYTPEILRGMTREQVQAAVQQTEPLVASRDEGTTGAERMRERLLADLKSPDKNVSKSAAIALNLEGGATSAAPQVVNIGGVPHIWDPRKGMLVQAEVDGKAVTTESVAGSQAQIKGATERAALETRSDVKSEEQAISNQRALSVYDTGINNLLTAFDKAATGPGMGLLPAIGEDSRILEGAISVMGPILKSLFREAGEGTFTDKDQEQLNQMMPNRSDTPAVAKAKIQFIDSVVRSKLGPSEPSTAPAAASGQPTQQQNTFTSSSGIQFTVQ
jgi:hypothetical protein